MELDKLYSRAIDDESFLMEKIKNVDDRFYFLLSLIPVNEIYFIKKAFIERDFQNSKQFLSVIGMINSYYSEFGKRDIFEVLNTFVFPILSDNIELIDRYMTYKPIVYHDSFATYFGKCIQAIIRKNNDDVLVNIKGLEKHSKSGWEKNFSGLVNCFKGFVNRDKLLVENGVDELLNKHNKQEQPTFVKDFINYEATTIVKLSNYLDVSLNIEHKLIPKELLPIEPLDHYETPYDFLRDEIS